MVSMEKVFSEGSLKIVKYLKKNNCYICLKWYCGLPIYKVCKNNKECNYPKINEETFCEIFDLLEQYGDYQQTHFYYFKK